MYLNDSSSIALHLKSHSLLKYKFRKILVENPVIALKIIKPRQKIIEALHIKTKKNRIDRITFENNDNVLNCL